MRSNRLPEVDNNKFNILKMRKDDFGRLMALAKAVDNISGDAVRRYGDRIHISFPKQKPGGGGRRAATDIITVAITAKPTSTSKRLTVREVEYTGKDGPTTDTGAPYKFVGASFEALPYVGMKASEYDGFEFTGTTPTQSATYFDARSIGDDRWMVSAPSVAAPGSRMAIVTKVDSTVPGDTALHIWVREIRLITTPTLQFEAFGAEEMVLVWPGLVDQDFAKLGLGTTFSTSSVVIELKNVKGVWYAMQTLKMKLYDTITNLRLSSCG